MDILKKISHAARQHATMKACMMGPRSVGKTTVLTSVFFDSSKSFAHTNLTFVADKETQELMSTRHIELLHVFDERQSIQDTPEAGLSATNQIHTFLYAFGIKNKKNCVDLEIKDFPGEFVEDPLHHDEIRAFVNESNTILIAIDTPHLMEKDGLYNEAKNKVAAITDFLIQEFARTEGDKLVLLVPLKCEKYFYEKRIEEVSDAVERAYRVLIDKIRGVYAQRVTCAITPILTMGGVVFDSFDDSSLTPGGYPVAARYKFYEKHPEFAPMFCAQPLYYLLSYVTRQYEDNKSKGNFFSRMFCALFDLFSSDIDLLNELKAMNKYRLTDKSGYRILHGKNNF